MKQDQRSWVGSNHQRSRSTAERAHQLSHRKQQQDVACQMDDAWTQHNRSVWNSAPTHAHTKREALIRIILLKFKTVIMSAYYYFFSVVHFLWCGSFLAHLILIHTKPVHVQVVLITFSTGSLSKLKTVCTLKRPSRNKFGRNEKRRKSARANMTAQYCIYAISWYFETNSTQWLCFRNMFVS